MVQRDLIPYEQSLELKELGFDEECLFAYYGKSDLSNFKESDYELCGDRHNSSFKDGRVSAPLYQQVFRWFRVKYNAHIYPQKFTDNTWYVSWGDWESPVFETYEEAELECLIKLIEIAKL